VRGERGGGEDEGREVDQVPLRDDVAEDRGEVDGLQRRVEREADDGGREQAGEGDVLGPVDVSRPPEGRQRGDDRDDSDADRERRRGGDG
jgi:hypothetical protein